MYLSIWYKNVQKELNFPQMQKKTKNCNFFNFKIWTPFMSVGAFIKD